MNKKKSGIEAILCYITRSAALFHYFLPSVSLPHLYTFFHSLIYFFISFSSTTFNSSPLFSAPRASFLFLMLSFTRSSVLVALLKMIPILTGINFLSFLLPHLQFFLPFSFSELHTLPSTGVFINLNM